MPHDPITTYLTTCDPKIGRAWSTDEDGLPMVLPLRECEQWLQLESLNDLWLDAVAGRPAQFEHPDVLPAFRAMQSAATWQARFPHHPALAALEAQLEADPLFLLLGQRVLWEDQHRNELRLPGLAGGLYIEGRGVPLPDLALDPDTLHVSGLIGVAFSRSAAYGLTWVRVAVWPLPHDPVNRLITLGG